VARSYVQLVIVLLDNDRQLTYLYHSLSYKQVKHLARDTVGNVTNFQHLCLVTVYNSVLLALRTEITYSVHVCHPQKASWKKEKI